MMMMMKRIIKCIVRITVQALPTPSQHFPYAVPCSLAIARIDLTDWCHKHDWAWPVDVKLMSGSQLRWNTKKNMIKMKRSFVRMQLGPGT